MIDVAHASELLDFGTRIDNPARAKEQLEGAVAIHNLLAERGVAYLADEVGMGKTYVALGAAALFRHHQPGFRLMVIAPRENIQAKWKKEAINFIRHNVRYPDLRVKSADERPARALVTCGNLLDLVREVCLDPNRDFFLRLTSFSLPVRGHDTVDPEVARNLRNGIRAYLPWLDDSMFDLRSKDAFKHHFAKAVCCALPPFDLVIVDEAHNLKHGFGVNVAARNRGLAAVFGHPDCGGPTKLFPDYGPRARRILFLSATPVEESYRHLWNQLNVFGHGSAYKALQDAETEAEQQAAARQFLIRRVTSIRVGGVEHTRNLYRREWRRGGVIQHDEPIRVEDPRQRLVLALVQKKVSELLGHERFGSAFQIGMLASFESFLQTARLHRDDPDGGNFDDAEQTDDPMEREGIDVADVNKLADSYRREFSAEMPHPKMDAVVESMATAWSSGRKSLIFVRRVASVRELKRKLDHRYDCWLKQRLLSGLPALLHPRIESLYRRYHEEKRARRTSASVAESMEANQDDDPGGIDTFFAWFFRGNGPKGVVSGANIQRRFVQSGTAYATFFEDNYVARILNCRPADVEERLVVALTVSPEMLREQLRSRSRFFLSRSKKHGGGDRFEALQAAAVQWLAERAGPVQEAAGVVWRERFAGSHQAAPASEAPEVAGWLALPTFFTELRQRPDLRDRLWPASRAQKPIDAFREDTLRAQLLATAARLGHSLIDLYLMTVNRLGSLELRTREAKDDADDHTPDRINGFLDILERQMSVPLEQREWGAFDELSEAAANFDLIVDVNAPDVRDQSLSETARSFGQLLRQQQPVAGMSGQVNQTLVRQFRMPGYPFVMVTTDLLQEGEDLHTFCSSVHHYGIAWTPSAMEQRIGRIDRLRSHTDRRLAATAGPLLAEAKLQVFYPHLEETVEVLQVQRVLERMNRFLRLMHTGLVIGTREDKTINANQEFASIRAMPSQPEGVLRTAFPILAGHLTTKASKKPMGREFTDILAARFSRLHGIGANLHIAWEPPTEKSKLFGTALLGQRVQPFALLLQSLGERPLVRCISPVGRVYPARDFQAVLDSSKMMPGIRVGAILTESDRTYDLTVEGDCLLDESERGDADAKRVESLINRIVGQADALELQLLPGRDEALSTFRRDMDTEGDHDR